MEKTLLTKVYDFVQHIIHLNDIHHSSEISKKNLLAKKCPVTGLIISMQPKNSKFLSYTGIKWYYEHDRGTYDKLLAVRINNYKSEDNPDSQFKKIAHSIRNADSNPRNNTKRAIQKLLLENKNSLFNNLQLIDKHKLLEAGINNQ